MLILLVVFLALHLPFYIYQPVGKSNTGRRNPGRVQISIKTFKKSKMFNPLNAQGTLKAFQGNVSGLP